VSDIIARIVPKESTQVEEIIRSVLVQAKEIETVVIMYRRAGEADFGFAHNGFDGREGIYASAAFQHYTHSLAFGWSEDEDPDCD